MKKMPKGMNIELYIDVDTGRVSKRLYLHKCTLLADHIFMLAATGLYPTLWSLEKFKSAKSLIQLLKKALVEMNKDPEKYKKMDCNTRYGSYTHFKWRIEQLLEHCETHFKSKVSLQLQLQNNVKWSNQKYIDRDIKKLEEIIHERLSSIL